MGVKGLWSLLNPVARPVQIESMEGKRLAIDSSIWLYQFQATMRDKDGRVLVNAHVLGFLRRINKLLFHGIKPVFVFDGGAPALKRATIAERKRKKAGAAANHARVAEKLFAAQMRREAVKAAQGARDAQTARQQAAAISRCDDEAGEQIAENAIYLEDLEGRPGPSVPRPPTAPSIHTPTNDALPESVEERRKRFRKHDPYRLPETTMPTVSTEEKPDARLATEEELKQFIDDMHPSDIDIESAEFRALPTEVQYEIIGDLRIRSRQQSHKRLADMLRAAPTALDFSKAQIKHLSQRNALTQQLLTVTDMVGSAHLTIPVRIAAERNREYVLVKRGEEAGGGWALGIREGTKAKPIVVEPDLNAKLEREFSVEDEDETNNSGIEEVLDPRATMDTDLREHRRREILEAITARYAPKRPSRASLDIPVQPFGASRAPGAMPLFATDEEEEVLPTANDEALALALQQEELGSDEVVPDEDLARALAMSRRKAEVGEVHEKERALVEVEAASQDTAGEKSDDSVEEMEEVSLVPSERTTPAPVSKEPSPEEDEDFVEVVPSPTRPVAAAMSAQSVESSSKDIMPFLTVPPARDLAAVAIASSSSAVSIARRSDDATRCQVLDDLAEPFSVDDDANDELRLASARFHFSSSTTPSRADVAPTIQSQPRRPLLSHRPFRPSPLSSGQVTPAADPEPDSVPSSPLQAARISPSPPSPPLPPLSLVAHEPERMIDEALASGSRSASGTPFSERRFTDDDDSAYRVPTDDDDDEDVDRLEWSRSPSPVRKPRPPLAPEISADSIPSEVDNEVEEDEGEMAREDMVAEEDDYARFMAQIKNRDLNEVRTEIDDEIRVLNSAKKVAMRDSDEITQGMIAQIQTLLRHFGIPYITAPMEAEAQCAKLAELGLVDGIITDDSDVFLFGGIQCFKNIFNDAKYAECFVLSDVERELSLTRERLISLAYLLGSDYTIGLPGVGPVVALELLANFPGPTGIDDFKTWWTKVQRGQDTSEETNTKWKASFKKRYSSTIFLTADWPNPLVREAYKYPTTDESEESFHWGFPKLSALRSYLHEELSWSISKVDDELTPIVQRIARRGKVGAFNIQATLDPFFDLTVGFGNYAPRRRTTANVSKRLIAVIKQFREAEARVTGKDGESEWSVMMQELDPEDPRGRGPGKRRRSKVEGVPENGKREEEGKHVVESEAKKKRVKRNMDGPEGNENGGVGAKEKPRGRPRNGTESSAPRSESGEAEGMVEGMMPVQDTNVLDKKERRAQQKQWRRAAVAGSIRKD